MMKLIAFISFLATTASSLVSEKNELKVPVELYNNQFKNPATPYPPRYVVGSLGIPHLLCHLFTFDLGNSRDSILTTSYCLGCDVKINGTALGCPLTVPTCSKNGGVCWESDPGQPLPLWSYTFVDTPSEYCVNASGYLTVAGQNVSTCMECFGGMSHSRFISMAQFHPDIPIYFLNDGKKIHPAIPSSFQFGTLVRTVPLTDRIWSNIGIGYNSSFLVQMDIRRFLLRLSNKKKEIIFHPFKDRHQNVATSSVVDFTVDEFDKRLFHFSYVKIGHDVFWMDVGSNHSAHLDTGNDGIYISERRLQDHLANITGGFWSDDKELLDAQQYRVDHESERLYIPKHYKPKPLRIALGNTLHGYSIQVTITNWIFPGKKKSPFVPTIFGKYDHTVFGLPYLAAMETEYMLDDENFIMHIVGGEMVRNGEQRTELL